MNELDLNDETLLSDWLDAMAEEARAEDRTGPDGEKVGAELPSVQEVSA